MTYDPGVLQEPVDVTRGEARHAIDIEAGKRLTEVFPLAQDRQPAQSRLEALETDLLEQTTVIAHGPAPLFVVVLHVEGIGSSPPAAGHNVLRVEAPRRTRSALRQFHAEAGRAEKRREMTISAPPDLCGRSSPRPRLPLRAKLPEDPANPAADRAEHVVHGTGGLLPERAFVQRTELCGDVVAILEILDVGLAAVDRPLVRQEAHALAAQGRRRLDGVRGQPARRAAHEVAPDGQCHA